MNEAKKYAPPPKPSVALVTFFHMPTASPLDRCIAGAIDGAIFVALFYAAVMAFGLFAGFTGQITDTSDPEMKAILTYSVFKALFLVVGCYYLLPVCLTGQTLGKRIMRLKVVTLEGRPAEAVNLLMRETLGRLACLPFGTGYLMIVIRKDQRGLHDIIANTKVVKLP